jgi:hypothetical protein
MSFDPSAYKQVNYSGQPFFQSSGVLNPRLFPPRIVPLLFDWLVYFTASGQQTNISVPISLQGGQTQGGLLDYIKAVKIDNTNSTISVSVWFPDTGDIVTAPPQSVVTAPVMTNGLKCFVIAQGLVAGFTPVTRIYLTNVLLPPSTDQQVQDVFPQWLGSPNIQLGASSIATPGYGPPALGDQTFNTVLDTLRDLVAGPPINLWNTPRAKGFITLTGLSLNILFAQAGATSYPVFTIGSTGSAGVLYNIACVISASTISYTPLFQKQGLQLKLDATQTWQLSINVISFAQGQYQLLSEYTYNPNQ